MEGAMHRWIVYKTGASRGRRLVTVIGTYYASTHTGAIEQASTLMEVDPAVTYWAVRADRAEPAIQREADRLIFASRRG